MKNIKKATSIDDLLEVAAELYRDRIVSQWSDYVECDELDEEGFCEYAGDLLTNDVKGRPFSKLEREYAKALSLSYSRLASEEADPYEIAKASKVLCNFDEWWSLCHQQIKEDNDLAETEAWLMWR